MAAIGRFGSLRRACRSNEPAAVGFAGVVSGNVFDYLMEETVLIWFVVIFVLSSAAEEYVAITLRMTQSRVKG